MAWKRGRQSFKYFEVSAWSCGRFIPRERATDTHQTEGWEDPGDNMYAYMLAKEKILPQLGIERQSSSPLTTEPSLPINNLFNEVITRIMGLLARSLRTGVPIWESEGAGCKTVLQIWDIQNMNTEKQEGISEIYINELPVMGRSSFRRDFV